MAGPYAIRILVVDGDTNLLDDYQRILAPPAEARGDGLFAQFESDLIGAAVAHKRFPEIDVVAVTQGHEAVDAVRAALDEGRPFAVAFIDLYLARGFDGLRTAEQIRALDPDVHVVLVSARPEVHPVEMSERVPPADQLFFVSKPFHATEIQQLVLALAARWRGERWQFGGGRSRAGGLPEVLDRLPAGALVFDRRDRLLAANDAMGELFPELAELFVAGTSYEEIQRGAAERLLPENTLMRVDAWLAERMEWHLRSGGAIEQRLRGARWVLLVEEVSASGETICLYYDVTELKRREASRATAAHMTQMAQSFAALCEHLDGLAGASGAAGGGAGGAGAESALGSRREGGADVAVLPGAIGGSSNPGHLQTLAARLQAIAQRQKLVPERLSMNRIVGEVVRKLRGESDSDIQMEVIAGAGLWPVLIDGEKFETALAELIRNACEAMEGGGRLTVETVNIRLTREFVATRAGLAAGEYVRISVHDTGPGMAPELVERALNPFFTSKDKNAHIGLGLSEVYGFTHQSGGYIEVDGGEGRGATIDLYFPRGAEPSAEPIDDQTRDGAETEPAARAANQRRA